MTLPVIFLMGPTATGKTAIVAKLFKRFPIDIISVDSALVYRGMDIGTAKPSKDFLHDIPHRLIDICEPDDTYSVAKFRDDALQAIEEIHAQSKVPLLVGGTNLYFHALELGLSDLPDANATIRQRLVAESEAIGWEAMHCRLAKIDPVSANRIHPNDPQRIQRALEIYEMSGRSMTDHYANGKKHPLPLDVIKIILTPSSRSMLHKRIQHRFMGMLDRGFIEEVNFFHGSHQFSQDLPAMRIVGYRQIWDYLDGKINYEEMCEKAMIATKQLAKRQMTWLRKEENAIWFDAEAPSPADTILNFLVQKHANIGY